MQPPPKPLHRQPNSRNHRRSGLGQNTKDWTIELVCVYFSKFSVPFFLFLASSRWFSLSVVNLFTCIIFVCRFLFAPWRVSPETRESRSTMRFGRPSHYPHCAYYAAHPLHHSLHNIHIAHTLSSMCRRE